MKLLLVCGPFGSGTTAVAGGLAHLVAIGFGPYFRPADERTRNSHELVVFRDVLLIVAAEETLTLPTTIVRYAEPIKRPIEHISGLAAFGGLNGDADVVREAAFIRCAEINPMSKH